MHRSTPHLCALGALVLLAGLSTALACGTPENTDAPESKPDPGGCTTAVDPKPISTNVTKGLDWLVAHQHDSGGWGQGEESTHMRNRQATEQKSVPNVADTCIATDTSPQSGANEIPMLYPDRLRKPSVNPPASITACTALWTSAQV